MLTAWLYPAGGDWMDERISTYTRDDLDTWAALMARSLRAAGAPADEPDLAPAHERALGEWARREHGSDFLFVTGYGRESMRGKYASCTASRTGPCATPRSSQRRCNCAFAPNAYPIRVNI